MAGSKTLNYSNKRLNTSEVLRCLEEGLRTIILLKETQLIQFLKTIENKEIELEPTNATTEEILGRMLEGAAIGALLGGLAAIPMAVNPFIGVAAGTLVGAGLFGLITKYKITIKEVDTTKDGVALFQIKLKPTS